MEDRYIASSSMKLSSWFYSSNWICSLTDEFLLLRAAMSSLTARVTGRAMLAARSKRNLIRALRSTRLLDPTANPVCNKPELKLMSDHKAIQPRVPRTAAFAPPVAAGIALR